jgi:hypothetical protein
VINIMDTSIIPFVPMLYEESLACYSRVAKLNFLWWYILKAPSFLHNYVIKAHFVFVNWSANFWWYDSKSCYCTTGDYPIFLLLHIVICFQNIMMMCS